MIGHGAARTRHENEERVFCPERVVDPEHDRVGPPRLLKLAIKPVFAAKDIVTATLTLFENLSISKRLQYQEMRQ
jgi:hypothetical protein